MLETLMRPTDHNRAPARADAKTAAESSGASTGYGSAADSNSSEDFNSKLAQATQTTAAQAQTAASRSDSRPTASKAADANSPHSASTASTPTGARASSDRRQQGTAAAAAAENPADADATATDVESDSVALVAAGTAEPTTRSGARRPATTPVPSALLGDGEPLHVPTTGGAALSVTIGTATDEPADLDATQSNAPVTSAESNRDSDNASGSTGSSDAAQLASLMPMLCGVPSQAPLGVAGVAAAGGDGVTGVGAASAALRFSVSSADASDRTSLTANAGSDAAPSTASASGDRAQDASGTGAPTTPLAAFDSLQSAARTATPAAAVGPQIHAPVGSAQWPDELASQLTLMTQHGLQSAELKLTPAHMGPLQIQIDVQNGAASVWFHASDAHTRAALEQSLPRLRELFAAQGLALSDAGVHREPPRPTPSAPTVRSAGSTSNSSTPVTSAVASVVRIGLIDAYA